VLNFSQKAKQELSNITQTEERIELLEIKKDNLLSSLRQIGLSLSKSRQKAARKLENEIKAELNDLKLVGARIKVSFQRREDPEGIQLENGLSVAYYPNGLERVEFLIETNPGEGFKPLVKIASGGETSRLMMALKYVLANADRIYTLIFDEIDQGIGGRVGAVVGKKLFNLSCQHQILCITHLPQLAAFANQHFHVEKTIHEQRTTTQVDQLHDGQRVEEIAKMLGGISEGTLKSADELLQSAKNTIKPLNNCN
jgi:DNA repair protein RecN (Recombination protein N)